MGGTAAAKSASRYFSRIFSGHGSQVRANNMNDIDLCEDWPLRGPAWAGWRRAPARGRHAPADRPKFSLLIQDGQVQGTNRSKTKSHSK